MRILLDTLPVYLLQSLFVCAESALAVSVFEVGVVEDTALASCSVLERVTAEVLGVEELGVKEV